MSSWLQTKKRIRAIDVFANEVVGIYTPNLTLIRFILFSKPNCKKNKGGNKHAKIQKL